MQRGSWILKMVLFGALMIGLVGLVGLMTKILWNLLVPMIFAGPFISFWQALGLLLLSKIILWPLGGRHCGHRSGYWKPYWREKWNKMTDEEKMQFRQKMKEKCSWGRPTEGPRSTTQQ